MALVLKDRVKETTTVVGTGTATLLGAPVGYQTFAAIGNGNTCYYTIAAQTSNEWEVGIGTYTSSGTTLSRDTVLASSNSGNLVNFSAGTKDVFVTQPAEKAVYGDATGLIEAFGNGTNAISFTDINTANLTANTVTLTAGTITTNAANGTDITNKNYVDGLFSTGISYHDPVRVESPTPLTVTYNQPGGAGNGVGATLTNAGTQAALVIDGVTLSVNDRVLIYTQTNQVQNGIYTVTNVGSGSTNWVMTRATDADTYGLADPNALGQGDAVFVQQGNTGAGETYVCNTSGTITFGTTNITFAQISSVQVYSAGTGLNLSNLTFSIANTAVTAATYGNDGSVGRFTVNAQGQITNAANVAINASSITTGTLPNAQTTASSANGANTIVLRDSTGSFTANTITATTSNATTFNGTTGAFTNVSGNGSALTAINASNISSGTIANARTTANTANSANTIVARDADGSFGANIITATFSGNAAGLSAINASNISSGTIANARTTASTSNGASTIVQRDSGGSFEANTVNAVSFVGNAAQVTNINASNISTGTIANARTTASSSNGASTIVLRGASGEFAAGAITGSLFTGNGSAISAINASNISTGTIDNARTTASSANGASTIVARDAGGNFAANTVTATTGSFTSVSGNGVALTAINASNIASGTIANARTTASDANGASTIVSRDANGSFSANIVTATFSGNGATLTNINASNISTGTIANARTTAATANGASTIVLRGTSGEFSAGAITGASFTGSGSGISAINASNISSGTISNDRTTAASANGASTIVARDASGNFTANVVTATTFSGGGGSLSAINASNISTGTIANARTTGATANGASTLVLRDANGSFAGNVGTFNGVTVGATNSSFDSDVLFVDATNNRVGVGTTAPGARLSVTDASPSIYLTATTTTSTTIGNKNNRLVLLSDSVTAGAGGEIVFAATDTAVDRWGAISGNITNNGVDGAAGTILFATKALNADTALTSRMAITAGGDVGIGTTTPVDGLLHLNGGTTTNIKFTNATTGTANTDGFYVGLGGSGDAIAYIYQREASAITFGTSNTERMRIDSSGAVFIAATAASSDSLNANGFRFGSGTFKQQFSTGFDFQQYYISAGQAAPDASVTIPAANSYSIKTNSSERLRITSTGAVGIGTSTPLQFNTTGSASARLLTVYNSGTDSSNRGEIQIGNAATGSGNITGNILFGCGASTTTQSAVASIYSILTAASTTNATGALVFSTTSAGTSAERMRITEAGNIRFTWNNNSFAGFFFDSAYYQGITNGASTRELFIDSRSADTRADIVFRTGLNTGVAERMRITSAGDIGIGTASPSYKLDVSGDTRANRFLAEQGLIINKLTISTSYTIPSGYSAMSTGPVTLSAGVVITVPAGSKWAVL